MDGPGLGILLEIFHLPIWATPPFLAPRPHCFFSFPTSVCREFPVAGAGDTSSSLAGGSRATPERPSQTGHTHSHGPLSPPSRGSKYGLKCPQRCFCCLEAVFTVLGRRTWAGLAGPVRLPKLANCHPSRAHGCRKWVLLCWPTPRNECGFLRVRMNMGCSSGLFSNRFTWPTIGRQLPEYPLLARESQESREEGVWAETEAWCPRAVKASGRAGGGRPE